MEFLVVSAIEMLRERGVEELSLNFAAFARLPPQPEGLGERAAGAAGRLADRFFQIESLYRFNAKFTPRWQPRYLLYEPARWASRGPGWRRCGRRGSCRSRRPAARAASRFGASMGSPG